MSCFDDNVECLAIEDVGRVNDLRRMLGLPGLEAGRDRAMHFAGTHAIDQHAVAANQIENRQIRARLLGVAHDVERRQVGDPLGRSWPRRKRTRACRIAWPNAGTGWPAISVRIPCRKRRSRHAVLVEVLVTNFGAEIANPMEVSIKYGR